MTGEEGYQSCGGIILQMPVFWYIHSSIHPSIHNEMIHSFCFIPLNKQTNKRVDGSYTYHIVEHHFELNEYN
jgi:hypothetical protein